MANKYAELTFTDGVRQLQEEMGSRAAYRIDEQGEDFNHVLTEREMDFIARRDRWSDAANARARSAREAGRCSSHDRLPQQGRPR